MEFSTNFASEFYISEIYQIGVKILARIPISEIFDQYIKMTEIYD